MNKEVFIRPAEISDAEIMAEVVAESWKIAYGNLISEDDMKPLKDMKTVILRIPQK